MRVGLINGCFDTFHDGHYHALREAAKNCDYLIVAVNTDWSVKYLKGAGRPIDPLSTRILNIQRSMLADAVIPFDGDKDKLIMSIKPHVYFVGYDHTAPTKLGWYARDWKNNRTQGQGAGFADVIQLSHLPGYSTTAIVSSNASNPNA